MDDIVSRSAAIDAVEFGITYAKAVNKETGEIRELFKEGNDELIKAVERIKELPSAQPEPQWIPCSERLPENGRQVLVYARSVHYALAKYDEMRDADGVYRKQWVTFDAWKPFYTIKEVIAWMPLPEAYKKE